MTALLYFYLYRIHDKDDEYYYTKTTGEVFSYQNDFGIQFTFAAVLAIHSIRALMLLAVSKTFGPVIEILTHMLREVGIFAVIQGCIILIFLISMRILFFTLDEFKTIPESFLTLFSASLSNFDFDIFKSNKLGINKWWGYGIMMLFLGISAITLVNFLIGIISNVYDTLKKVNEGLYNKKVIDTRQALQSDELYSSMISSVPPFNLFSVFYIPFLMWYQSKKLNKTIMHFNFFIVQIIAVFLYLSFAILFTPFAYLITLMDLFSDFSKSSQLRKSKCVILVDILIFFIFGIVICLIQSVIDTFTFFQNLYDTNLLAKHRFENSFGVKIKQKYDDLNYNFYCFFLLFLKQYPKSQVYSKSLIKDLSASLQITNQIKKIIFM